jgi:hypothetical protein
VNQLAQAIGWLVIVYLCIAAPCWIAFSIWWRVTRKPKGSL